MDVAARLQHPLVRFNVSDKTTEQSLFGSARFTDRVIFKEGPFTQAFRSGAWLLLDEVNLASTQVLSALERAIESGRLVLSVSTDELEGNEGSETKTEQAKRSIEYVM